MWPYINLFIALAAIKGSTSYCLVTISIALSFFIIGLFQLLNFVPSDLYSFVFGGVLYALPCIVAFSSPFTLKRALMALFSALLMLLEVIAAYLWLVDSYSIVGLFYRPTAIVLYSLLAIVCFWRSNGRLYKRNGSYYFRFKGYMGSRQTNHVVLKGGSK